MACMVHTIIDAAVGSHWALVQAFILDHVDLQQHGKGGAPDVKLVSIWA
jgi:hypothetical protein